MGSTHFLPLSLPTLYYPRLNPTKTSLNSIFSSNFLCLSSSRPNWEPNPDRIDTDRFGFDDELGFGLGGREKRRNWWSDDDGGYDEEDDDDDDADFEFFNDPTSVDWVFKVFRAFGWIVPAVIISTLVGTGTNSLIMALVLPLGQTALSLVMDKLWGGSSSTSNPEPRPRTRPRPRPRYRNAPRPKRNPFVRTSNGDSAKKNGLKFGGWDELDEEPGSSNNVSRKSPTQKPNGLQRRHTGPGKLSRRINREKPLFMRLLIAVFPFLGSWTGFLF